MDSCGFFLSNTQMQAHCFFEINDNEVCMEPVNVLGERCAAHTWAAVLVLPPRIVRVRELVPDERRCTAIKHVGGRCKYPRIAGTERCGVHRGVAQPERICTSALRSGAACTRLATWGGGMCGVHARAEMFRLRRVNLAEWRPYDTIEIDRLRVEARREHRRQVRNFIGEWDLAALRAVRARIQALYSNALMQRFLRLRPEPLPTDGSVYERTTLRVDRALQSVIS